MAGWLVSQALRLVDQNMGQVYFHVAHQGIATHFGVGVEYFFGVQREGQLGDQPRNFEQGLCSFSLFADGKMWAHLSHGKRKKAVCSAR